MVAIPLNPLVAFCWLNCIPLLEVNKACFTCLFIKVLWESFALQTGVALMLPKLSLMMYFFYSIQMNLFRFITCFVYTFVSSLFYSKLCIALLFKFCLRGHLNRCVLPMRTCYRMLIVHLWKVLWIVRPSRSAKLVWVLFLWLWGCSTDRGMLVL